MGSCNFFYLEKKNKKKKISHTYFSLYQATEYKAFWTFSKHNADLCTR